MISPCFSIRQSNFTGFPDEWRVNSESHYRDFAASVDEFAEPQAWENSRMRLVCWRRVLSGAERRPGVMGTDDISRPNNPNREQNESNDESLRFWSVCWYADTLLEDQTDWWVCVCTSGWHTKHSVVYQPVMSFFAGMTQVQRSWIKAKRK